MIPPVGRHALTAIMVPSGIWVILTRDIPQPLAALMATTMVAVLSPTRPSQPVGQGASGPGKGLAQLRPSPAAALAEQTPAA